MEDLELARACALYADDKKAENIRILDLRGISPISDYFVICTALSTPQLRAVRDEIIERMKEEHGTAPNVKDGNFESQWIIIVYGNVMVHILTPEKRDYYSLEELWGDASELALTVEAPEPEKQPKVKKAAVKKVATKKAAKARAKK
jgi:ribosome-associated protein